MRLATRAAKSSGQMEKAAADAIRPVARAHRRRCAGAKRGAVPFQFNPKEVTISKSAKWERKTTKGVEEGAARPSSSGAEPSKMTLGDVLRRHRQARTVRWSRQSRSCSPAVCATPESAGQKKATPPLVVLHWGTSLQLPGLRHLGERGSSPCSTPTALPIRAACSVSLEEMPGEKFRAESDVGQP